MRRASVDVPQDLCPLIDRLAKAQSRSRAGQVDHLLRLGLIAAGHLEPDPDVGPVLISVADRGQTTINASADDRVSGISLHTQFAPSPTPQPA